MEHLTVFAYVIILLIGMWVTFTAHQYQRNHGLPLLRHLFHYTVTVNVLLFLWLAGLYSAVNLLGDDRLAVRPELAIPLVLAVFMVEIALAYSLLGVVSLLKKQRAALLARHTLAAGVFLFGVSLIVGATLLIQSGSERWLVVTQVLLMVTGNLWIAILLAGLLRDSGHEPGSSPDRTARSFALLLLPGYLVLIAVHALPPKLHVPLSILNPLWLNLAPLIWLRGHWTQTRGDGAPPELRAVLAALGRTRQITQRELEVMELILEGKSNKEIEELLCISVHTVKNHAYNLYRKLGVSSRGQLVSLVLSEQRNQQV